MAENCHSHTIQPRQETTPLLTNKMEKKKKKKCEGKVPSDKKAELGFKAGLIIPQYLKPILAGPEALFKPNIHSNANKTGTKKHGIISYMLNDSNLEKSLSHTMELAGEQTHRLLRKKLAKLHSFLKVRLEVFSSLQTFRWTGFQNVSNVL